MSVIQTSIIWELSDSIMFTSKSCVCGRGWTKPSCAYAMETAYIVPIQIGRTLLVFGCWRSIIGVSVSSSNRIEPTST